MSEVTIATNKDANFIRTSGILKRRVNPTNLCAYLDIFSCIKQKPYFSWARMNERNINIVPYPGGIEMVRITQQITIGPHVI